jgi:signal transduction histidine kinase
MVAHFPELGSFHHAAVRPGTNQFAAYDGDRVKLVDWQTRQTVLTLPLSYGAFRLAWSPDGRWLAVGGNALEIQVHDVIDGRTRVFRGNRDTVYDVHFDVTGQRLAATSSEGASLIWDFADGQLLDLATDRRLLRWGTAGRAGWLVPDQRLELWRTVDAAGYSARRGADETADPWQMDVSADGRSVACLSPGRGLLTWELASNASPVLVPFPGIVSFGFDPRNPEVHLIRDQRVETTGFPSASDGRATGGTGVASWETEPSQGATRVVTSADGGTRALTQLSPGRVWIRARGRDGEVRIPEIQHSSTAYEPSSPHGAGPIALSPNGRWLACGADGFAGTWIYDTRSGQRVQRLDPRMGGVHFSPDSRWLVLGTPAEVRLFHTANWTEAWSRPREVASSHWFATVAIAPDGRQVAFATSPHQIALLETGTGRELVRLESPGGLPILSLRWSPDGEALLAMERDSSVDIWRPRALQGELAWLGLGWGDGENKIGEAGGARGTTLPGWIALGVLLTAGAVAAVALLSLRRHRRLIEDFSRSESLAVSRERELEIERRLSQLKSSFVSMVSHEFRTPLGITMSAVELLQHYSDRIPPEKREALLADIHGSTRHMSDLMEQVLLLGRAEAGKLGFRPALLDLPALARRLAEETSLATQQRCPLEVRLEGTLEGAVGDEALLRHILGNLLSNATKYSPAGAPVELIVRRESSEAIVQVRDRGIGIPEEDLPQLFQAFHRAGNVGKIPGTGLGLAIVKRCVTLHHGSVEVASPRGAGTEFTVRLPLFSEPPVAGEIRLSSDGARPGTVAGYDA